MAFPTHDRADVSWCRPHNLGPMTNPAEPTISQLAFAIHTLKRGLELTPDQKQRVLSLLNEGVGLMEKSECKS